MGHVPPGSEHCTSLARCHWSPSSEEEVAMGGEGTSCLRGELKCQRVVSFNVNGLDDDGMRREVVEEFLEWEAAYLRSARNSFTMM